MLDRAGNLHRMNPEASHWMEHQRESSSEIYISLAMYGILKKKHKTVWLRSALDPVNTQARRGAQVWIPNLNMVFQWYSRVDKGPEVGWIVQKNKNGENIFLISRSLDEVLQNEATVAKHITYHVPPGKLSKTFTSNNEWRRGWNPGLKLHRIRTLKSHTKCKYGTMTNEPTGKLICNKPLQA